MIFYECICFYLTLSESAIIKLFNQSVKAATGPVSMISQDISFFIWVTVTYWFNQWVTNLITIVMVTRTTSPVSMISQGGRFFIWVTVTYWLNQWVTNLITIVMVTRTTSPVSMISHHRISAYISFTINKCDVHTRTHVHTYIIFLVEDCQSW